MGSNVATISIPYSMEEYDEGTVCTVTGWGTTTEGGSLARVLQKVDVPVVSDEHCRDSYGQSDITDSMSCPELFPGVTGARRPATQEYTHRPHTLLTGSTPTCKLKKPQQIHNPTKK